jgi:hypothetical protein
MQKPHVKAIQLHPERVHAFALCEIALLVSLMSADKGVSQLAAQSLRIIAEAERHPDAPIHSGMSTEERCRRHPVYERLGDPNVVVVGESNKYIMGTKLSSRRTSRATEAHQKTLTLHILSNTD